MPLKWCSVDKIDIWIIHSEKRILVTDFPGPPAAVCGFVSEEAAQAAEARGGVATVSEIGFPSDCWLTAEGWPQALALATEKAGELGYEIKTEDSFFPDPDGYLDEPEDDWDWSGTCPTCGGEFGNGWSTCTCDSEDDE